MLLKEEEIIEIEGKIGYEFKLKNLLVQAFIRRSFTNELPDYDSFDIENNEVLELLGDKVLDYIVVKKMASLKGTVDFYLYNYTSVRGACSGMYSSSLNEGKLTDIKRSIVEKKSLAAAMSKLGLQKYLVMGKGDIAMNIQESDSVKEDLFEAILGAVAIDCDWNMEILEKVLFNMYDIEDSIKHAYVDPQVDLLWKEEFLEEKYNIYYNEFGSKDRIVYPTKGRNRIEWRDLPYKEEITICDKNNKILGCYFGVGDEREKALNNAKFVAINDVKQTKVQSPICALLETLTRENAVDKMNELCQKGLIEKQEEFIQNGKDAQGNPLWNGKLMVVNYGGCLAYEFYSKKELKKEMSYCVLLEVCKIAKGKQELFPLIYEVPLKIRGQSIEGNVVAVVKNAIIKNEIYEDIVEIELQNGQGAEFVLDEEFIVEENDKLMSLIQDYYNGKAKELSRENIIWYDQNPEEDNSEIERFLKLIGVKVWDKRLGEGVITDVYDSNNFLIEMENESIFANHTFSLDHICKNMAIEKEKEELLSLFPELSSISLYEKRSNENEIVVFQRSQDFVIPKEHLQTLRKFLNENDYFKVSKIQVECKIGYLLARNIQKRLMQKGILLEAIPDKGNPIVKEGMDLKLAQNEVPELFINQYSMDDYKEIPLDFLPSLYKFLKENEYFTIPSLRQEFHGSDFYIDYLIAKRIRDSLVEMGVLLHQGVGIYHIIKDKIDALLPYFVEQKQ